MVYMGMHRPGLRYGFTSVPQVAQIDAEEKTMAQTKSARVRGALFGGALLSAGVANAAMFEYAELDGNIFSLSYARLVDLNGNGGLINDSAYFVTEPETQAERTRDGWAASALTNTDLIRASIDAGTAEMGIAAAAAYGTLNMTTNTDVRVDWDFGASGGSDIQILVLNDERDVIGTVFDHAAVDGAAGSLVFSLDADTNYLLRVDVDTLVPGESIFGSFTAIPAPGAAVVAGIAGITAVRRRR